MGTMLLLTIISGVLLFLLIVSGIRLRLSGEPYKVPILTGHKIISVAIIVLLAIVVGKHLKFMEFGFIGWLLTILSLFLIIVALGTGGALTND